MLFIAIVLYSCTASETEQVSDITFEELKARVNANAEKLYSLDADGEISIDSPGMSNTGTITVSILKPDSIYTKLEGPFGIDVADMLITRNEFLYYNVNDNKVISGLSTPQNLRNIIKVYVSFDEILNAFSGKFSFGNTENGNAKITMTEDSYIVSIKSGNEIRKYWVESKNFYVTRLGTYDLNGNTKIEIVYENFYTRDDIIFPKKISISRPKEKQFIWLTYYNEEFNNNKLTYKLKIPKSAKRIKW